MTWALLLQLGATDMQKLKPQDLVKPAHVYLRRTPEQTLLYQIVARHLDSFSQSNAERGGMLPWFVQREFEGFLKYGILAHGFVRVYCRSCKFERLVAFSVSSASRHMGTAHTT